MADVKQFASRDEAIRFVQDWSAECLGGYREEPDEKNGILFWRVGRNASHEFYAGVGPDGRLYQRSYGESDWIWHLKEDGSDDLSREPKETIYKDDVQEVQSFGGYYGHY